ncbi:MAG: TonB-dependent receptor [Parabacteroides sp.]|nr:TonB-dependent receptor [Parabacteroides sp.]
MSKILTLSLGLVLSGTLAMAQTSIKGTVVDDTGEPVIGASIIVIGTSTGTVTNFDGSFSIAAPQGAKQVKISYVGMIPQTMDIKQNMAITLKSDSQDLDEVVVVAYGTTSARNLTGAVSSVKGEAIKNVPGPAVDAMLQGRASGVMISSPSSSVGTTPVINIRGVSSISNSTTPLYVVDGMIVSMDATSSTRQNPLADINSADIKSIEILKDAAATALYGSRAANGVIMITTNIGSKGKAKISYSGGYTIATATGMIEPMNAEQYTELKNLGVSNTAARVSDTGFYDKYKYGLMYDSDGEVISTNWADLLFQTGSIMNHDINVSGATDDVNYYISTGIMDQDGISVGDEFKRYSFKANTTFTANEWLKGGFNGSYSNTQQKNVDSGYGDGAYSINGFSRMAAILPSNIPAYNEDGTPYMDNGQYLGYGNNSIGCTYYNPMSYIDEQASRMENNRIIASGFLEANPVKGLSIKSQYGVDWFITNSTTMYSPNGGDGYASGGNLYAYATTRKTWTWTNTANYQLDLKEDNHFNATIGMEAQEMKLKRRYYTATTLADKEMIYEEAPYLTYSTTPSYNRREERSMVSYLGRLSYNYKYRYYLEGSFRRDGLSALGTKWGNFWGASASWRISDEAFYRPLKNAVNDLRFKASYGVVGNTNLSSYAAISKYESSYYNGTGAYYPSAIADRLLGWEQTAKTDIGLTGQIANRWDFEVTYFKSTSKDLVLDSAQSYSTGIPDSQITTNLGKARNQGLELSLGGNIVRTGDFSWDSNINLTFVKNKVLELESDIVESGTAAANITVEGKSMAQLYIYPTAGIDSESGRRVVLLDNDNGEATREALLVYTRGSGASVYDRATGEQLDINDWNPHIMGNTKPTYYGGWNNNFSYKGWDATLFFQFSGGNKIYNGMKATTSDMRFWNNTTDVYENIWRNPGDNATYAKAEQNDNYSNGSANPISDWVENGDYLRLKDLSIGYTFDTKRWPKKIGISQLRLYASATNLFCITGYTGMDPEISSRADISNTASGIDKNTTPLTKTYSFGINLSF